MIKSNSRKKGFILTYGSRGIKFIVVGKAWQQKQEVERSHFICIKEADSWNRKWVSPHSAPVVMHFFQGGSISRGSITSPNSIPNWGLSVHTHESVRQISHSHSEQCWMEVVESRHPALVSDLRGIYSVFQHIKCDAIVSFFCMPLSILSLFACFYHERILNFF